MRSLYYSLYLLVVTTIIIFIDGCCDPRRPECMELGNGGGQDSVTIDLPFDNGYTAMCVQGAGGSYSHRYNSTRYDVDLDTPNTTRDLVYAPVGGIAYVHDDDREGGFGVHVNIDMQDGTYILLAHLDDVFVDDGSEVAEGEILAFEGTTGNSTGDHVHMGRHDGDASSDGANGTSIEGLALYATDTTTDSTTDMTTSDMTCDLSSGHRYASLLVTPRWHPNGTLVKTPDDSTVYLIENGGTRAFVDEASFWSHGYDFDDVALVSDAEIACYTAGENIGEDTHVNAVDSAVGDFRDGNLVSEVSSSTVYVMSDGIAMPVETWDAYLLMGFASRTVIEVNDGAVDAAVDAVGDCATNAYCVSREDIITCGGPSADDEGSYPERVTDTGDEDDETVDEEQGGADSATGSDSSTDGLAVMWTTPSGAAADRITLSGEYTHGDGWSEGWQTLMSVTGLASLTYEVIDAASGDTLRFSAEFVDDGTTSWSCLAPYPPGTVQGIATATYRGSTVDVVATDDPGSDGCGLLVTVP